MIVPMKKVFVVGRADARGRLVDAVRAAGVLHLLPVDAGRTGDDPQLSRSIERLERAQVVLAGVTPAGEPLGHTADAVADEALALAHTRAELEARQAAIVRELKELQVWGDVHLDDVHHLHTSGLHLSFIAVPEADVASIRAELAHTLGPLPGRRVLMGVAGRAAVELPRSAEVLELPDRDRPALREESAGNAQKLQAVGARLAQLAQSVGAVREHLAALRAQAADARVLAAALADDAFFGVQGWVPADGVAGLRQQVAGQLDATVFARDPDDAELPPTLVRPPRWARPVMGLMGMLGLSPGYREADVSAGFMIALPLFAAMLISDAGYGALLLLAPLLVWKRTVKAVGKPLAQFLVVLGGASVVWGALTGAFFGVDVAKWLTGGPPLIVVSQDDSAMRPLMRLSFTIGVVHLSLAQLWRAALLWPDRAALGRVGWAAFLWGMYGVVTMFVLKTPLDAHTPWPWLLAIGAALAVLFGVSGPNPFKAAAAGLANFPLSALGTFSDIMSYVRLMAVGLAGSVLAVSFNQLAVASGPVLMVPILVFGHGLNIGLCLIALFAHGVRLNVLEFSNNFGLEWSGFGYQPLPPGPTFSSPQQSPAPGRLGAANQES